MLNHPVGIRSIAVSFPNDIRTNDYWRKHYPEWIDRLERKNLEKAFVLDVSADENSQSDLWTQQMMPYLSDPFRGTVERRILGTHESSLTLEYSAAKEALASAKLNPSDIDLMIVTSIFSEEFGIGNAAVLAGQLGLHCPAWNLTSMCSSPLVSLQNACALIQTGEYRNILVVVSCTYSRFVDANDTLSMLLGDGGGAFVISPLKAHQGILGTKFMNTAETSGAFFIESVTDNQCKPKFFIKSDRNASQILKAGFVPYFRSCCEGALAAAGVTLEQIDFFVGNPLLAWYSNVYVQALGINPERTIDIYPYYGNIGVASIVASLYHAAQLGKIRENDLILVYAFGGSSNCGAIVMRWGDVALGATPKTSAMLEKCEVG